VFLICQLCFVAFLLVFSRAQNDDDIVVNSAEDLQKFHQKLHVGILKYAHGETDVEHEKARKGSRVPLLSTIEERGAIDVML
jgi:hypothetical protein